MVCLCSLKFSLFYNKYIGRKNLPFSIRFFSENAAMNIPLVCWGLKTLNLLVSRCLSWGSWLGPSWGSEGPVSESKAQTSETGTVVISNLDLINSIQRLNLKNVLGFHSNTLPNHIMFYFTTALLGQLSSVNKNCFDAFYMWM